jgi:hypothetical protein
MNCTFFRVFAADVVGVAKHAAVDTDSAATYSAAKSVVYRVVAVSPGVDFPGSVASADDPLLLLPLWLILMLQVWLILPLLCR